MNKRYAIWYEPSALVYDELKKVILDLSEKYDSPIFEPHITLLPGGSGLTKEEVVSKLKRVLSSEEKFETTFDSYTHSDNYFRSIFIKVKKSKGLIDFTSAIQKEFNGKLTQGYFPHLTVFYSEFSGDKRQSIIKQLGGIYEKSFALKEVKIIEYELGEPPERWKEVASIGL